MLLIHIFRIKYNIIECYLYLLKGTNKSFFGWGGGAKRIILISIHFNKERWFEIRVFWVTSVVLEQNKYHISRNHCTTKKTFAWHLPTVLLIANNFSSRKEMLNMFNNFFGRKNCHMACTHACKKLLAWPQFFDRLKLFGMPAKHQPDFIYLRHVPLRKVHLFTLTQLTCLVLLWVIKTSPAAIVFPMMVSWVLTMDRIEKYSSCFLSALLLKPHVFPAGVGSGIHPQTAGPVFLQSRAQLPGWFNAGMEEKKPWWCFQKDWGGSWNVKM